MMATGCGKAGCQEMISVALSTTPKAEGLTSDGQGEPTLETEAQHRLFRLLTLGFIHRSQLSDWHTTSSA